MPKKNVLVAQLGKGDYKETGYVYGEDFDDANSLTEANIQIHNTGYTFEATYNVIKEKYDYEMDNIVIIGTSDSKWDTLYQYYKKKCRDNHTLLEKIDINDVEELQKNLSIVLCEYLKREINENFVRVCVIEYGKSDKELHYNFFKLKDQFEKIADRNTNEDEGLRVYFDISNGFRSLPMYIYSFGNYMLTVWNTKVEMHMYYGMFECKKEYKDSGIVPMVDLEDVNDLMRWINAANEFNNYGAVREIIKILDTEHNKVWNISVGEKISNNRYSLSVIFKYFDYASNANNLHIMKDVVVYISNIKDVIDSCAVPEYAGELLKSISERFYTTFNQTEKNERLISDDNLFKKYKPTYSYSYLTIMLAKYYFKQDRIGHAAIALQEGVTTYIMERWSSFVIAFLNANKSSEYKKYDVNSINSDSWNKWLFDYYERERIARWFKYIPEKKGSLKILNDEIFDTNSLSFIYKMNIVREVIRNQEAHILAKKINDRQIDNSEKVLHSLIIDMERRVKGKVCNEEEIFNDAYGLFGDIMDLNKNILHELLINQSRVNGVIKLSNEYKVFNRYKLDDSNSTDANDNICKFKEELKNTSVLKRALKKWEPDRDLENVDTDIRWVLSKNYYDNHKKGKKWRYEQFFDCVFMDRSSNKLFEVLEEIDLIYKMEKNNGKTAGTCTIFN